jgi:dihydrofolate reductase
MRKLIYPMMMSLDGRISRPGGELDWVQIDAELHDFVNRQQEAVDAYILGRKSYEMMEAFWPTADETPDAPGYVVDYARIWREMPKVVLSSSLQRVSGNARLVEGDAAAEIARLKAEPGKSLSIGGPTLAASVIDLVDEFHIFLNPVVIGAGVPLIPGLTKTLHLRLAESRAFDLGVVFLRYLREGE